MAASPKVPSESNGNAEVLRRDEIDSLIDSLGERMKEFGERIRVKDRQIAELKDSVHRMEMTLGRQREDFEKAEAALAQCKADVETRADEKAQMRIDAAVSKLPQLIADLLKGEYTLKCVKCGSTNKISVTDEQARQLLLGHPAQVLCPNPSCIDEFSWGRMRHSMPLTFGPILRLKLSMMGMLVQDDPRGSTPV
jgi:hypothetical protein